MSRVANAKLLQQVLALPTAPLHEAHVIRFVTDFATQEDLRCRADRFGNLHLRNRARGKPRVIFMAHMDHPGVEVIKTSSREVTARIRGGLFAAHLARARFRFFLADGSTVVGQSRGLPKNGLLRIAVPRAVKPKTFGVLDLPAVRMHKDRVAARAIDNLAGCAQVLALLRRVRRARTPIMGVLTRGEEIGFHGASVLVRDDSLPHDIPIVVLEMSSAKIAKVKIGGGPVIRVGDRLIGFDPRIDCWLQAVAQRLAKKNSQFIYQRALMTGGAMEASLYTLHGLMVGSVVLPLGNYHNRGPRGPAPEYISWNDWLLQHEFLHALTTAPRAQRVVEHTKHRLLRGRR